MIDVYNLLQKMSRSRKKISIFKHATSGMKRLSNKKVRLFIKKIICTLDPTVEVLVKGNWYRKVLNPWNINDWVYRPEKQKYNPRPGKDMIEKGYRK